MFINLRTRNTVKMKKIIPLILGLFMLAAAKQSSAQSFSIDKDTVYYVVHSSADIKAKVTNTTSSNLNLDWKITGHSLPNDFINAGFGICDNFTCYNYNTTSDYDDNKESTLASTQFMDLKLQVYLESVAGNGNPWYITVTLIDSATMYSEPVTFAVTKWTTNVPSIAKSNNINMYPNPASDELNVIFDPGVGVKNITVYNLIGKAVTVYKTTSNSSAKLNIENLPSGVYFIRLSDNQGRVVANRKFTKQ